MATALQTEPYILPPFIAAIFFLYLQQYADIHSNRLPITNILYKDTTGGSLVWSVEQFLSKETLHKELSNYLKELKVLSNTEPALGNIIYCLKYSLGTL